VQTAVIPNWETRAVPAGLLSQSMAGPMPGDRLLAWLLVPYMQEYHLVQCLAKNSDIHFGI
jgi:hypothetical protein